MWALLITGILLIVWLNVSYARHKKSLSLDQKKKLEEESNYDSQTW